MPIAVDDTYNPLPAIYRYQMEFKGEVTLCEEAPFHFPERYSYEFPCGLAIGEELIRLEPEPWTPIREAHRLHHEAGHGQHNIEWRTWDLIATSVETDDHRIITLSCHA